MSTKSTYNEFAHGSSTKLSEWQLQYTNTCKVRIFPEVRTSFKDVYAHVSSKHFYKLLFTSTAYRRKVLMQSIRPCFFKLSEFELYSIRSLLTSERFYSRVCTFMFLQITFINCSIQTLLTGEGFNSRVCMFMDLQITHMSCSIRALITGEGFYSRVYTFMFIQITFTN